MDTITQVVLYVIVAVLASLFTYVFSIRTTKKSRLYDAKMKAYGDVVGLYQEALIGLDNLSTLQDVDASEKDGFLPNFINLLGELSGLGDTATLTMISDQSKFSKSLKQMGEVQFIESLRSKATILNSDNIARSLKEVRLRAGQLALVKPTDAVKQGLNRIQELFASGGIAIFQKAFERYPEVFGEIDIPDELRAKVLTPEKWREQVGAALQGLVNAMRADLDNTLSIIARRKDKTEKRERKGFRSGLNSR
ncbi:MAG: hypothetical protein KJ653_10060 [Candidatus Thermoplasmatota archaeon]|nr:hypothetical protein [Candidatus Thermoplasmatota archaeon]MBU1915408.1 hypothetical protein [Candidatus Thermoplasmatota archaeon]